MNRAAIYVRVSDESQVEGHSLDFQLEDCLRQAVLDGFGVAPERVYRDEGFSAKTAARPEFKRMVADAKERVFDRLYVWKWDRFARNREDAVTYKALLRKSGIELISIKEQFDTDTPAGALLEGVMEVVAEWYSADLRQKVARSRQHRLSLGLANGSPPFGYRINPESI